MRFKAVTFDCYGTLIDWDTGIGDWFAGWARQRGAAVDVDRMRGLFAEAQRRRQAELPFTPYRRILAEALADAATALGMAIAEEDKAAFAGSASAWPPFADTLPALAALKEQGRTLGVMSNIDADLFAGTAGLLENRINIVVTADQVQSYKPRHAHFAEMRRRLEEREIGRDAILHVAQSRFHDIAPANALGWANCWVDRRRGRSGRGVTVASQAMADHEVTSMAGLIALLESIDPA